MILRLVILRLVILRLVMILRLRKQIPRKTCFELGKIGRRNQIQMRIRIHINTSASSSSNNTSTELKPPRIRIVVSTLQPPRTELKPPSSINTSASSNRNTYQHFNRVEALQPPLVVRRMRIPIYPVPAHDKFIRFL